MTQCSYHMGFFWVQDFEASGLIYKPVPSRCTVLYLSSLTILAFVVYCWEPEWRWLESCNFYTGLMPFWLSTDILTSVYLAIGIFIYNLIKLYLNTAIISSKFWYRRNIVTCWCECAKYTSRKEQWAKQGIITRIILFKKRLYHFCKLLGWYCARGNDINSTLISHKVGLSTSWNKCMLHDTSWKRHLRLSWTLDKLSINL